MLRKHDQLSDETKMLVGRGDTYPGWLVVFHRDEASSRIVVEKDLEIFAGLGKPSFLAGTSDREIQVGWTHSPDFHLQILP